MNKEGTKELKKDFKTLGYFLGLTHRISKAYIPLLIISAIFKAVIPFINIIIPKFIIDELLGQKRMEILVSLVLLIIIGNLIFSVINKLLDAKVSIKNIEVLNGFNLLIGEKIMSMDFEHIEDPEILDLKERAIYPINTQRVIQQVVDMIVKISTQIITFIGLIAVISTLDLYIVLFIIFIVILNSSIYKKSQKSSFEVGTVFASLNRILQYFYEVPRDFSMGKDVRLYNTAPLIMDKIEKSNETLLRKVGKLFKKVWKYKGISDVNLQIQKAVIYGYMTYKVFVDTIGIGSFTMYVAGANALSTCLSEFIGSFINMRQMCRYLQEYIKFERIESKNIEGEKNIDGINRCDIEFKNVSFKYPRCNEYTLKNVSLSIAHGEKLSVVGMNGAGKTTFIKLLSRLYEPTEGEILLNGINIKEYDYEEYMKLLSVVFQDFKIMAFTIKENVALTDCETSKNVDIEESLQKSGLKKDVMKLSKGVNTHIYKIFEKDGIEFSGGQAQKLAISRAIYKDAPIVVLDEPTAALDPIAEFDIYSRFNELTGGKTAIYISHRLSSCRFCDKIAVFHKGRIIQHGSHEDLISDHGSQYEEMYQAQAKYYV